MLQFLAYLEYLGIPVAFSEYDTNSDRKTNILYFVAKNIFLPFILDHFVDSWEYIESLLGVSTKVDVTMHDFKSSALGTNIIPLASTYVFLFLRSESAAKTGRYCDTEKSCAVWTRIYLLFARLLLSYFWEHEIQEEQFVEKQKQFLDAFSFGSEKNKNN